LDGAAHFYLASKIGRGGNGGNVPNVQHGIGMVLIVPQQHASEAVNRINAAADYKAQIIGEVVPGNRQVILP